MPSRSLPSRRALVLAAALFFGGAIPSARADESAVPTRTQRASYWIDRLVRGPEPTPFPPGGPARFHESMLDDAVANLRALPDETLDQLAQPALRERLQSQANADPWHAILLVLAGIGKARPEVVRAWATPALEHDLLTLAREALPAVLALGSAEDAPALLRTLRRRTNDRVLGPGCLRALARLGPPWDGEAALAVMAAAEIDRPFGSSALWEGVADEIAEGRAPSAGTLAWWAILADASGPLARAPTGERRPEPKADRVPAATVRTEHALGSGAFAAARARAVLAQMGAPGWVAASRRDAASSDPDLRSIAHERLPAVEEDVASARRRALAMAEGFERGDPAPGVTLALELVATLAKDAGDETTRALLRLLETVPPGLGARIVLYAVVDALVARGADLVPTFSSLLASGERTKVDRALTIAQRAPSARFLPLLEAHADAPEHASRRFELRRTALFVVSAAMRDGALAPDAAAHWARRVVEWSFDPADRSGRGLLAALLDLGPAGEAALAAGLGGTERAAFLDVVSRRLARYLAPPTVAAILGPVRGDAPADERRRAISAAFAVAGSDSLDALRAFARGLRPEDRGDVEFVARIVAHRAASTYGGR